MPLDGHVGGARMVMWAGLGWSLDGHVGGARMVMWVGLDGHVGRARWSCGVDGARIVL